MASLGPGPDPAAILFERESGIGHPAAGRGAAPEHPAADAGGAAGECWPYSTSGGVSFCLNAGGMGRCDLESETLIAAPRAEVSGITGRIAHTLTAEGFDASEDGTGRGSVVVAINARQDPNFYGQVAGPLDCDAGTNAVSNGLFVRKLMARECHVLQGFPLDHCAIEWRGKPAADGPQCKALGNSMAVPVMRWLLDRARGVAPDLSTFDFAAAKAAAWGH